MSHWASLSQRGKGSPDVATMVLASCGRARCLMSFGSRHSDITLSLPSIGSGERDGNTVALVITSGAQVHRLTVPVRVLIGPTVASASGMVSLAIRSRFRSFTYAVLSLIVYITSSAKAYTVSS